MTQRRFTRVLGLLAATAGLSASLLAVAGPASAAASGINDFGCTPSAAHPEPVVFVHGTFANKDEDINYLQSDVASKGYCTFSLTYGEEPQYPGVGGLQPVAQSDVQIRDFIVHVLTTTGAAKLDIVGHSEGGLQSLYVTKFGGIANRIAKVVAIAPPTHGTDEEHLVTLGDALLGRPTLNAIAGGLGFPVLQDEFVGGTAVTKLNTGPIAQPGVKYTIIASKYDEVVTPAGSSSFVAEPGVTNEYVQDSCPFDPVGHIGEAYDLNVWHLVENALDPTHATPITMCSAGFQP